MSGKTEYERILEDRLAEAEWREELLAILSDIGHHLARIADVVERPPRAE